MFFIHKDKKIFKQRKGGFTLIELLVVIAIFGILSSIIIFNYHDFLAKVSIKSLANDIALQISQVQKNAAFGKQNPIGTLDSTWQPSYGLYFNTNNTGNTGNKVFYSFVDLPPVNGVFDPGANTVGLTIEGAGKSGLKMTFKYL